MELDNEPVAAVSSLADDVVDIISGYETMIEMAEADLQPHIRRLHALHQNHAARLLECVANMGGHPDDSGSMMGLVHSTVATARDRFGALDQSALDSILEGEERLLDSYEKTASATQPDTETHEEIIDQQEELRKHIKAFKKD